MIRPNYSDSEPRVPPETEFLVIDMETYVNQNVEEYLDGHPCALKATDYNALLTPDGKLPSGIRRLENEYVSRYAPGKREFSSLDILMQFPLQYNSENPINITFKWTDGIKCRIAIVDKRALVLLENNEATIHSAFIDMVELETYLNSCGLPKSIWGADLEQAVEDIDSSSDIHTHQRAVAIVDPFTTMEIVRETRFKNDNRQSEKILDELCLNIDHFDDNSDDFAFLTNEIYLPPAPSYRNMLRFEHADINDTQWEYRGAYSGKLEAGEFIDEIVQIDPKLVIPNPKVVAKALSVLTQKPY